jgi:hypothetical protein
MSASVVGVLQLQQQKPEGSEEAISPRRRRGERPLRFSQERVFIFLEKYCTGAVAHRPHRQEPAVGSFYQPKQVQSPDQ